MGTLAPRSCVLWGPSSSQKRLCSFEFEELFEELSQP